MTINILEQDIIVTIFDDDRITVNLLNNNPNQQAAIQFQDEGVALGTSGTVTAINFVGSSIVASRSGSTLTVTVSGGSVGSGDVTGPSGAVADNIPQFNGATGKILKDGLTKDGTGGLAGLTLFKINFKNALNTFTSFFTNSNTAARTYTFPDRDGTISDTYVDHVRGSTLNRYWGNVYYAAGTVNLALVANVLRAVAVEIKHATTIDTLACEIQTGTTGNIRLGIYADDGSGYPGVLVIESGQIAIASATVKTAPVSATLLPGLYWFTYLTDTANTLRASSALPGNLGVSSAIGANGVGAIWTVAQTYGAMPTPFTAGGTVLTTGSITSHPLILIREV